VNDQIAVRILHRSAHLRDEIDALGDAEAPPVAVPVDWLTVDGLDDEERRPVLSDPRVEEPPDAGMLELGEDLALGRETPTRRSGSARAGAV
jgi:hypothetical protein